VFVVDHGYHASLLLPRGECAPDGEAGGATGEGAARVEFAEYAYGQFDYFARNKDAWWRVPGVLLVPSQGALGNAAVRGVPEPAALKRMYAAEAVWPVRVERGRVEALILTLDERFVRGLPAEPGRSGDAGAGALWNPVVGLWFARDGADYWAFNTCNHAMVAWLRALGCRVSGVPLWAEYRVERWAGARRTPER
jgi:hypothetical protein